MPDFTMEEMMRLGMVCMEQFPNVSSFHVGIRFLREDTKNDPEWETCREKEEMPVSFTETESSEFTREYKLEHVRLSPVYFDQTQRGFWVGYCELTNEFLLRPIKSKV